MATEQPVRLDAASGDDWLAARLAEPHPGVATIVFHSIVMQYLPRAARERIAATLAAAGRRATAHAPLAWIRMEPGGEQAEVRGTLWPEGEDRLLATTGFHGRGIRWLA